ncbi:M4 family metallopeptidase [Streptomyces sp. NPDC026206]|uniref:M4 family metallopeptidase n=1 Tax=Streptomyces sp. NPDC026206 TaxID=3157089 RepID=UPI0033CE49FB
MALLRSRHRAVTGGLLAAAAVLASGLQGAPAGARPAAGAAGEPAVGAGCGSTVGKVTLDTTYNPRTGRYELDDPERGNHRTYDMNQSTTGAGVLVTDDDNVWCDGGRQSDAVAAHYIHAVFWDYYLDVHGRKGASGDGRAGCSRVHYGSNYLNAFYGTCMTYGDAVTPYGPLTRIDIGTHEMTHRVTAATANLSFSGESAGLNEATSDIFAVAAEFHADNPADPGDYLIAEDTYLNGDSALRHFDKPSKDGQSKDYWYSGISRILPQYASGPANHFFYLLAEGSGPKVVNGVSYDSPTYDGKPVTGIGRAAAEKIWFKALTQRMTSNTDYHGARSATLRAAADLYGAGSGQYRAVGAAWAAVNVT